MKPSDVTDSNDPVVPPGPESRRLHESAGQLYRDLSGRVRPFPVCGSRGRGVVLEDVDGNRYLDFSSGIYVTSLGHCHPKVSEAGGFERCTTDFREVVEADDVDIVHICTPNQHRYAAPGSKLPGPKPSVGWTRAHVHRPLLAPAGHCGRCRGALRP